VSEKPKTTFIGQVYDRKKAPTDDRKVLSLDKGEKRADGTWKNLRAVAIEYEDGSKQELPQHLVLKLGVMDQGNKCGNIYFLTWPDEKPQRAGEFNDNDGKVPF